MARSLKHGPYVIETLSSGFKLGSDSSEKCLPPGKLERSDSQIGRSYIAKLRHYLSV